MKIAIAGMSLGVLLARHHDVTMTDIIAEKVELVNHGEGALIHDADIETYLRDGNLHLQATTDARGRRIGTRIL